MNRQEKELGFFDNSSSKNRDFEVSCLGCEPQANRNCDSVFSLVLEIDYILFFEVRTFVALNPCAERDLQCRRFIPRVCGK